jgi:hypothetical protein
MTVSALTGEFACQHFPKQRCRIAVRKSDLLHLIEKLALTQGGPQLGYVQVLSHGGCNYAVC